MPIKFLSILLSGAISRSIHYIVPYGSTLDSFAGVILDVFANNDVLRGTSKIKPTWKWKIAPRKISGYHGDTFVKHILRRLSMTEFAQGPEAVSPQQLEKMWREFIFNPMHCVGI
jgi:hypothetical protein